MIKCFICNLDLSNFPETNRNAHVNRCLDHSNFEPKNATTGAIPTKKSDVFAGSETADLNVSKLSTCPICGCQTKDFTEGQTSFKKKMAHLRICANKSNIPLPNVIQLIRSSADKIDHVDKPNPNPRNQITLQSFLESTKRKASVVDYLGSSSDSDTSIKSVALKKRSKVEHDEDLQVALALSASINPSEGKRTGKLRSRASAKSDLVDWSSSSVLASEDAQRYFFEKTSQLLCDGSLKSLLAVRGARSGSPLGLWEQTCNARPGLSDAFDEALLDKIQLVLDTASAAQQSKIQQLQGEFTAWNKEIVAARDREVLRLLKDQHPQFEFSSSVLAESGRDVPAVASSISATISSQATEPELGLTCLVEDLKDGSSSVSSDKEFEISLSSDSDSSLELAISSKPDKTSASRNRENVTNDMIYNYITGNQEIYSSILQYRPISIVELQEKILAHYNSESSETHWQCNLSILDFYLSNQGVLFIKGHSKTLGP